MGSTHGAEWLWSLVFQLSLGTWAPFASLQTQSTSCQDLLGGAGGAQTAGHRGDVQVFHYVAAPLHFLI